LKSHCLSTLFLPEDHTGVNISDDLQSILESWSLPENKLSSITADNGSNVLATVEILGWNGLSCFGHNLHLAITNALKDDDRISRAVGIAHKIVDAFVHSWKRKEIWLNYKLRWMFHNTLVTECSTCWGTRYKMLDRILEQERALVQILEADPKTTHLKPHWQDTEVVESIVSALKLVSDLKDILSGEEWVTASCLKPLLSHLHDEALAEKEEELGGTTLKVGIQQRIKQYMKRKYDDDESIKSILNIPSCLDPRFMLKKCSDDEVFVVLQSIVQRRVVIK